MPVRSDWKADHYQSHFDYVKQWGQGLLALLDARSGERVLDVGCGPGHHVAQLVKAGVRAVGVDGSAEMIRLARSNYPTQTFYFKDARSLSFISKFDAIFSNATLHWIPEANPVIRGIWKALVPGGRFVAEFGGYGNVAHIQRAIAHGFKAFGLRPPKSPWYFPRLADYVRLLDAQGFEVVYASHIDRPTPLEGGARGLRHWIEMFGRTYVEAVPEPKRDSFFRAVETHARRALYRASKNQWIADYRRLQIKAIKGS